MPDVRIVDVNPLERADQIKDLFVADHAPGFAEFFDRAYPLAVERGGKSWVGVDAKGKVVTHIARFTRSFTLGERAVVGGVLLNLMAARTHRTLMPALALVRQMTSDSKAQRDVDFLYAVPNPAAHTLLKAAGFEPIGSMARFVLPLAGRTWYSDVPVRLYQSMIRARAWNQRAKATQHGGEPSEVAAFERPVRHAQALRPFRSPELFRQCLAGYPSRMDHWFTFHRSADSTAPSAAALARGGSDQVATLFSLSREPSMSLSAIMPALATGLRRAGYARLSVETLAGSRFARELTRVGFVQREDSGPLVGCAVTEIGTEALRSGSAWEITALDCDPYLS